jgi:DnaK suppressor protein
VTPAQRKALRQKLLDQSKKLAAKAPRDVSGSDDKLDEDAAPLEEMNQVIGSNRNKNDAVVLQKVQAALVRLDRDPDDFGFCSDCGDEIPVRRLEAMPWAELCVDCQSKKDARIPRGPRKSTSDFIDE